MAKDQSHLTREQLLEKAKKLHKQCGRWPIARMLAKHGIPIEDAVHVLATVPRANDNLDFTPRKPR